MANKVDLLTAEERIAKIDLLAQQNETVLSLSAETGEGIEELKSMLGDLLENQRAGVGDDIQVSREEGLFLRQTLFDQAKRVVIKVGSAVLTNRHGVDPEIIAAIARQISFLQSTGREVILVSSGAVAAGRQKLDIAKKVHEELRIKQALAATGQGLLMQAYEQAFAEYQQQVAQVLLTHEDLSHRSRYLNVRNTILTLFEFGVVPIINENDTVSGEELRFSDNDTLGALITNMIGADMFIILTDVDCLYTANPSDDSSAMPVYTVAHIDPDVERMAGHSKSLLGTGGMLAKINAAKMVAACGGSSFIGPGKILTFSKNCSAEK